MNILKHLARQPRPLGRSTIVPPGHTRARAGTKAPRL